MRLRLAGGFTLIEVLVALFVLAIGIAGAAATQLAALRTRHQSALLSQGVQLASALAERMRANAAALQADDAFNPYLALRYDALADGAPLAADPACHSGAGCDPAQLADADLYHLKQALHSTFPGGRVVVCRDAQVWDPARRALAWRCAAGGGAPIVIKLGWRGREHDGRAALDAALEFAPSVALVVPGAFE
jgi:type IV pilus assembly protein PilV